MLHGSNIAFHPELTRERSIRFLLFEIKHVFVYNLTVFRLTDLFILYFFNQNVYVNNKVFQIKGYKIMSYCDRKSQISEIFTFLTQRGYKNRI